jgi:hypothetical protein
VVKAKPLIFGACGLGVSLAVAVVVRPRTPDPAEVARQVRRLTAECLESSDPDVADLDWGRAERVCRQVLALDPKQKEAEARLQTVRQEQEAEAVLQSARSRIAALEEEAALSLVAGIPTDSSAYPRADRLFKEAKDILFKRNKARCRSEHDSGRLEQAIPACRRAMELSCNHPEGADPETMRLFQDATSRSGWKTEFLCPARLPFEEGLLVGLDPTVEVERRVTERYPDSRVAALLMDYFRNGQPGKVALQLKDVRASGAAPETDEVIGALEIVEARFAQWQALVRDDRVQDALVKHREAVEAESRFLPPLPAGTPSHVLHEMGLRSAALVFAQVREALEAGRYDLAAPSVLEAYRLDPRNTDIVGVVGQMERDASRRMT